MVSASISRSSVTRDMLMCHLHWERLSNVDFKNCEEFRRSANTSLEIYIVKKIGHTLCATTLNTSHIMHAHQLKQIIVDNLRPIFFTNFFCEQVAQNGHLQCDFYSCWKSVNVARDTKLVIEFRSYFI